MSTIEWQRNLAFLHAPQSPRQVVRSPRSSPSSPSSPRSFSPGFSHDRLSHTAFSGAGTPQHARSAPSPLLPNCPRSPVRLLDSFRTGFWESPWGTELSSKSSLESSTSSYDLLRIPTGNSRVFPFLQTFLLSCDGVTRALIQQRFKCNFHVQSDIQNLCWQRLSELPDPLGSTRNSSNRRRSKGNSGRKLGQGGEFIKYQVPWAPYRATR